MKINNFYLVIFSFCFPINCGKISINYLIKKGSVVIGLIWLSSMIFLYYSNLNSLCYLVRFLSLNKISEINSSYSFEVNSLIVTICGNCSSYLKNISTDFLNSWGVFPRKSFLQVKIILQFFQFCSNKCVMRFVYKFASSTASICCSMY